MPLLLGPWSHVQVDPSMWGHGKADLVAYTVKAAAVRRVQLRALQMVASGWYAPGSGCRPKLWDPPPSAAGGSVARSGLEQLEMRWRHSFDTAPAAGMRQGVRRPAAAEFEVGLLPCQRPGKRPRLGVWERVVGAQQLPPEPACARPQPVPPDDVRDAAAPGPPGSAERALWRELRQAELPREQYGTVYRVLHGSLYVGALLCHIRVLPKQQACCAHPACQGELETLSHAFLLCPAVAPAAEWVCGVFGAVAGCAPPPASARVLLADDDVEWVPPGADQVWLALRAAYLHAVWQLRCRRSLTGVPFSATGVCGAVVAAVSASIRRDWARATEDLVRLSGACPEWFRGGALRGRSRSSRSGGPTVVCCAGSPGGKGAGGSLRCASPWLTPCLPRPMCPWVCRMASPLGWSRSWEPQEATGGRKEVERGTRAHCRVAPPASRRAVSPPLSSSRPAAPALSLAAAVALRLAA